MITGYQWWDKDANPQDQGQDTKSQDIPSLLGSVSTRTITMRQCLKTWDGPSLRPVTMRRGSVSRGRLPITMRQCLNACGGTAAAAPPPFRPGNPALCGSCPLVTPYYCRLGDLLCYTCMLYLSTFCVSMHVNFVFFLFFVLFSFVASFSTVILLVGSFDL